MAQRESWATRAGFILAAVGSAVGLGNIWRFPYQVGEYGGAAFLVVYLLLVALIGFPVMLVEFTIGRRTERNPVGALKQIGEGAWTKVGWVFVLAGFVILSYYSVVAGWILRYTAIGLQGNYAAGGAGAQFMSVAGGMDSVVTHAIFMAAIVTVVAFGIQQGIEFSVKLMVPAIIALLIGLAVYAGTLSGAGEAYAYYLSPDLGTIAANWTEILPAAAAQAFFTLSLGMGVMITYASYLGEDRNLAKDGTIIVALDTAIAFTAGLVAFPVLYTAELTDVAAGPSFIFVSLAQAFSNIPFGGIIGAIFFAIVTIAALSSAISIMEVVVSYLIDEHGVDRLPATIALGVVIFVVGLPVAYEPEGLNWLVVYDGFANSILLILGGLLLAIYIGWVATDLGIEELGKGIHNLGSWGMVWIWTLRVPVIIVLLIVLTQNTIGYYESLVGIFG
ncbi:sodium:neurotransmitter symporter [Haloterrigena turkmenica DSM 5511]|uniref:Transporter n=1 Tax=Haloterrigena turkmenica (strain ATCC 51198 / DSM 5511 / JCM 9101 / NCIMB 13204 / VKM B-1734 / 4k) TaxID=543526 RepID=D2RS45_HALTV|nr:sodium-dependent transporter [Haloterrigena turkmenica]ADB60626.1 sodium:neurotransmitter symporter [Haloterrigena turkmenica DSM 5511]